MLQGHVKIVDKNEKELNSLLLQDLWFFSLTTSLIRRLFMGYIYSTSSESHFAIGDWLFWLEIVLARSLQQQNFNKPKK